MLDMAIARRIARAHGWVRTGSRIRDCVDQIARARFQSHEEEQAGTFFWPTHLDSDTNVVFRRPGDDDAIRPLAEICLPELRALVDEMTKHGHVGERLVYAEAKEAAVGKLAHAGRQRIEKPASLRRDSTCSAQFLPSWLVAWGLTGRTWRRDTGSARRRKGSYARQSWSRSTSVHCRCGWWRTWRNGRKRIGCEALSVPSRLAPTAPRKIGVKSRLGRSGRGRNLIQLIP